MRIKKQGLEIFRMENRQNLFIKAKDSEYLHNIICKKDWASLIELASGRNAYKDLLFHFFQSDDSLKVLNSMTEEQILNLLDVSPLSLEEKILSRMEPLCDKDTKFSNIALKLMKELYTHGGDLDSSIIVKCLPINVLRAIIDSRVPNNKFRFGQNKQEFFMFIISSLQQGTSQEENYHYRYLKERDCAKGVFVYITEEINTFPLGRREVFKEVIKSLYDAFLYIESNDNINIHSNLIQTVIAPIFLLITHSLQNKIYDYRNDKEIIELLRNVFNEFYSSKFFLSNASIPILNGYRNNGLINSSKIFEKCKIISPTFYYKVFKKAIEVNNDNFVNRIARVFFTSNEIFRFIRELDDGVYDTLFNASIKESVRELIEMKRSGNFSFCCKLLTNKPKEIELLKGRFIPTFDECLKFIKTVISQIFEKKESLNFDYSIFPEICCFLLNNLNGIECSSCRYSCCDVFVRNQNKLVCCLFNDVNENVHRPLDFLDAEMRNNLVLGVIRHPADRSKFSSIINSNNPTYLVKFICFLASVRDIKLLLPEEKRGNVDQFGFMECKSNSNSNERIKINIVEVFLQALRFWENNDKSLFRDGYLAYYQFVRKILIESIITNDYELKKEAIRVYYRFSEIVSLVKNARYLRFRICIASLTFLTPIAVIVGSEIDEHFVEKYIKRFIQPFNPQSYHLILSEILSRSHLNMNYEDDEDESEFDEIDSFFKKIYIDHHYQIATRMLLELIKENPVKIFHLYYTANLTDPFFISKKRFVCNIMKKFDVLNPSIIDLCNPLKTEHPLSMKVNSPEIEHVYLNHPQYKMSSFVFLEICRFIEKEFRLFSPKLFKTKHTKQLMKIQAFLRKLVCNVCDTFRFVFTLDKPTIDTIQDYYFKQEKYRIIVNYSHNFFDFLNEINGRQNSIFNDESFEIIKRALIARFLSEQDFLRQRNQPLPKFTGFQIIIEFKRHRNAVNIFNVMNYKKMIDEYEFNVYKKVNQMNQKLIKQICQVYNIAKLINDNPFDDVFNVDLTNHRSREKSESARKSEFPMTVHKCFTKIMDSLNKCCAERLVNDFECLERLVSFKPIKNCGSDSSSYSMLTSLLDLLINNFVLSKNELFKACKNCVVAYDDIYRYMTIVARIASPNIGQLNNLHKLCLLKENNIDEKVTKIDTKLFHYIFKCGNIDQILLCMNSYLFESSASFFYKYLQKTSGLLYSKEIINTIINEIVNNGKQVLDVFHVSLAQCSIYPRFVGFPVPQTNLEYLKMIANRSSLSVKRSACANAVYYAIMSFISGNEIPLKDVNEIIEMSHKKAPDEITAFFCLLISRDASMNKMNSLPALFDLKNEKALPESFIINQGPKLIIPKDIGQLYFNCIEKVILSGLKSNKPHIYKLTVTVLNEINVGPEIQRIISPFIEKGLNGLQPNDDNEAFLKYATSFTMKNPEFNECFTSYCEALKIIKNHSFEILKANKQFNLNSPYPESFKKLERLFLTILKAIEKPFIEFKDENEMKSVSLFCSKLIPFLASNRPAVSLDVFLQFEGCLSIFADEVMCQIVHLYKLERKVEALSSFIILITHHDELIFNLPKSIVEIYNHLKSDFGIVHTIQLARNLKNADLKLQQDYKLAKLLLPEVLSHIPDQSSVAKEKEKGVDLGIESEDEIVDVISNLGIFCKNDMFYSHQPMPRGSNLLGKKIQRPIVAEAVCGRCESGSIENGNSTISAPGVNNKIKTGNKKESIDDCQIVARDATAEVVLGNDDEEMRKKIEDEFEEDVNEIDQEFPETEEKVADLGAEVCNEVEEYDDVAEVCIKTEEMQEICVDNEEKLIADVAEVCNEDNENDIDEIAEVCCEDEENAVEEIAEIAEVCDEDEEIAVEEIAEIAAVCDEDDENVVEEIAEVEVEDAVVEEVADAIEENVGKGNDKDLYGRGEQIGYNEEDEGVTGLVQYDGKDVFDLFS